MLILGVHRDPYHNTGAAALYDDGREIKIVAISQERLDRKKDSAEYPDDAIDYCLNALGAESLNDCDLIVSDYIFRPEWNNDRSTSIRSALSHSRNYAKRIGIKHSIPADKVEFVNHHLAHACSAFYGSGFEESAILVVDGHGSLAPGISLNPSSTNNVFETQSLYVGKKGSITCLESSTSTGIGMMYQAFTNFLGFGHLQEGKTMGLAPYGSTSAQNLIQFKTTFEGMNTDYSYLVDIWDKRKPVKQSDLVACHDKHIQTNSYYSRIAHEVQTETERAMLHLAQYAKERTNRKNLCLSGGVALNSVANNSVVKKKSFDEVWIQPASSDTGIPLGCALHGYYHLMGGEKSWRMENAYLGRPYSENEINEAISKNINNLEVSIDPDYKMTAELIANGHIVALFNGASEYGPRALGHRSIVVDPRKSENKDILNSKVKNREAFRPFAPSVLLNRAREFFDIDANSPFMLLVPKVQPNKISVLPAITHVDGTARVQTVTKEQNGLYFDLIKAFEDLTGVPVLLNTSFNVAGEPIVETPEEAIECFLKNKIDVLVLEHFLLKKSKE